MARRRFLEAGKIVATQGLRGDVRVEPWCDGPSFLLRFGSFYFDGGKSCRAVASSRAHGQIAVIRFEGIDTVEAAMPLVRRVIYIDREEVTLPAGSYFEADLIDLDVVDDASGKRYGKLTEVMHTGANDVYAVRDEAGGEVLIPAIADVVAAVVLDAGGWRLPALGGLLDGGAGRAGPGWCRVRGRFR